MRRRRAYFAAGPDDPAPIVTEVRRRIAFSEVDAMAVAWHGNYLRFFEAAHSELMAKIGLTFAAYAEHRLAAPVVQSHVDYFSPLLLDEVNRVSRLVAAGKLNGCEAFAQLKEIECSPGCFAGMWCLPAAFLCAAGFTVQMFCSLDTREPCLFPPAPVAVMRERWRKGEWDA